MGLTPGSKPASWGHPVAVRLDVEELAKLDQLVAEIRTRWGSWPRSTRSSVIVDLLRQTDVSWKGSGRVGYTQKPHRLDIGIPLLDESTSKLEDSVKRVGRSVDRLGKKKKKPGRRQTKRSRPIGKRKTAKKVRR